MIIDTLSNATKYYSLHPLFKKAFEYVQSRNFQDLEPGDYEIDGEALKAVVFKKAGKTAEESLEKFECHDAHIDIQICLQGEETIGWKPRESCVALKGEYNPAKDVSFYNEEPDMFFKLHSGQFVVFFPEDVHAPMIGEGEIKKMVVKVKI